MNEAMYISFESYLHNEMPADEKKQFEEKLENDPSFRESFELYRETTGYLENKFSPETATFKQNLKTISAAHFAEEAEEKPVKVVNLKPWYYAVAASMALLFGTLIFNQSDPQYGDYNQHETAVFTERGTADTQLKQAQDAFNAHEYKKAVAAFEKIANLTQPELQYYYAIALIETSAYPKAELLLDNLRNGTSVYKDKATWYLALSHLKQHQLEPCKALLKQVPEGAEDYEKAQQLLDDLE